jgi:uncharacterized protein
VKNLLEFIIKSIVSNPNDVVIEESETPSETILLVKANKDDYGKIIGKNGRVIQSLRSIIKTANKDKNKKYFIKISE